MLVEAANAVATPATLSLQVRRPLPDVMFPESFPYDGLVKRQTISYTSTLPDAFKDRDLPASSPYIVNPKYTPFGHINIRKPKISNKSKIFSFCYYVE